MNNTSSGHALTDETGVLICPMCGYQYTHAQRVYEIPGCDPVEGGGRIQGLSEMRPTDNAWRRDGICIEFQCELGCTFRLRLQQHKGETFVLFEIPRWRQIDDKPDNSVSIEPAVLAVLGDRG